LRIYQAYEEYTNGSTHNTHVTACIIFELYPSLEKVISAEVNLDLMPGSLIIAASKLYLPFPIFFAIQVVTNHWNLRLILLITE
jgi:hypothetical protein